MNTYPRENAATHLLPLGTAPWALWRALVIRGAGFPASTLLDLAAPGASAASDVYLFAISQQERARLAALVVVQKILDEFRRCGRFETEAGRLLLDEQRALSRGKSLGRIDDPEAVAAVAVWQQAVTHCTAAREAYEREFARGVLGVAEAIQRHAANESFQEAILWQNRQALLSGVQPLLRTAPETRNSSRRQKEELVANYLQRYCAKNDTIGFFGPSCWGRLTESGPAISSQPGSGLLASRHVYLESWGIEALASTVAEEPGVRSWIAPSLRVRLEGGVLTARAGSSEVLSSADAALLAACNGRRPAAEIAADLVAANEVSSVEEVYRRLEAYRRSGVVSWDFEIPVAPFSEQNLRRQFEAIGDPKMRRSALDRLDEVEAARDGVSSAAGDPQALDRSLGALEATFTRLTGAASTRAAGRTYAGRTLVYEDCSRDLKFAMGPELVQSLAGPMELLLAGVRWFLHEFATDIGNVLRDLYGELVRKSGSPEIDMVTFWYRLMPLLIKQKSVAERALPEFRRRWARILAADPGESPVIRTSAELRQLALELFTAPPPAWEMGRYHSPDLMIAAESVEAIRRGDYQFVLGEIHIAMNSLNNWVFLAEYPNREEVACWIDRDLAPRVVTMPPKQWPGMTTRCQIAYLSAKDHLVGFWKHPVGVPQPCVLPTSELVIVDRGDGLVMESRDGRHRFGILDVFGPNLTHSLGGTFDYLEPAPHTPRVVLDKLVLCRETWRIAATEMAFATVTDAGERFCQARGWAQERGIPRFVFVKAPAEQKPFYVDLNSPVLVEGLARAVRRSASLADPTITITEMLPNMEQLWLTDAQGSRFTSELRLAMLDLLEESA